MVDSRIGKVAGAVTATTLIRDFDVDAIVFTGVAGALADELTIGDVVVARELVQHDMACPPELFERGEIPLLGLRRPATDPALAMRALTIGRRRVHVGRIAAVKEFIRGGLKDVVRARVPKSTAVDMERAAVAQVCHEHGVVPLLVIRAISDPRRRYGVRQLRSVP